MAARDKGPWLHFVGQFLFIKEIENVRLLVTLPDANTQESLGEFENTYVNFRILQTFSGVYLKNNKKYANEN